MGTYQLGRKLVAASGVVEAHLGADATGAVVVLSRLAAPWSDDRGVHERLQAARPACGGVEAPSLARLLEWGTANGELWFVEGTGEGEPLRAALSSRGPLNVEVAVAITERIAQGLTALHDAGGAHGDVSASSVFFTSGGRVLLLHAGVAGIAGSHPSRGPARSEPHAVAPEQLVAPPTAAADVFRMGLLLLEMLTGKSLFVASDPLAVLRLAERFEGPTTVALVEVPAPLQPVLLAMLERDPRARPSAPDVGEALGMASASLSLSTGDAEIGRLYRAAFAGSLGLGPVSSLTLTAPLRAPAPPRAPHTSVLGKIGTRRVTHEQLEAAKLEVDPRADSLGMREALVAEHWLKTKRLTPATLSGLQQRGAALGLGLTELVVVDGVMAEDDVVAALAAVTKVQAVKRHELELLGPTSDGFAGFPPDTARSLQALPVAERAGVLVVAVRDPFDVASAERLKRALGRPVQLVWAGPEALRAAVARLYPLR